MSRAFQVRLFYVATIMAAGKAFSKTISIDAAPAQVWEALTTPALLQQWMSADNSIEVISGWAAGSPIVVRKDMDWMNYENKGTILQFRPDELLQYSSWTSISELPDTPENYSLVAFRLVPVAGHTQLTLTHSNLMAKAAFEHAAFYWHTALEMLRRLFNNP